MNTERSIDSTRLLDSTFTALDEFRHGEQTDDALVVAARILTLPTRRAYSRPTKIAVRSEVLIPSRARIMGFGKEPTPH